MIEGISHLPHETSPDWTTDPRRNDVV